ncbi:MAG: hypothetical protein LBE16_02570 [Clostridiales Family XIII bacterium]|nr:hypothetical protein [Clostridiales Family XIII bacterium]
MRDGKLPNRYKHLVKPLNWREGPAGLYPDKLFFMEGASDMEGLGLCFSFLYVKAPCSFHPMEGSVSHPYDEVLVFASLDRGDILHLGAEISIELGPEREEYAFSDPVCVCVPRGLAHGPVRVRGTERPFVHYAIALSPAYAEERVAASQRTPAAGSGKYAHLIKPFLFHRDENDKSEMGYALAVDARGVGHPAEAGVGPGNADSLLWLFGSELEDFPLNFTWGHYSRCGKWHRAGEMHSHPEEEALFFVGLNPDDPLDFGAEPECGLGPACERHIINRPSVYVMPPNLPHLPVILRWVDRPYGLVVCNLSGVHASPWSVTIEDIL